MGLSGSFRDWLAETPQAPAGVLLDIDGVLITSHRILPGAREAVDELRTRRIPVLLLTNDGCNSPAEKLRPLAEAGLLFSEDEVVSSGHALADCVMAREWQGQRFFVAGSLGTPCYAETAGLEITRDLSDLDDCFGVIVGEKAYDWESVLTGIFNFFLSHFQAPLIVPNPDICYPLKHGRLHPASGATAEFITFLCRSRGIQLVPIWLGKPYEPIFECAMRRLQQFTACPIDRRDVLVIGDSLTSDIAGGDGFGCRTALVLTGLTTRAMLGKSQIHPDLVFDGL